MLSCPISVPRSRADPLRSDKYARLAKGLPRPKISHSQLLCALSGDILDEHNPPLVLPNGYAYGERALRAQAAAGGGFVTCPITGEWEGVAGGREGARRHCFRRELQGLVRHRSSHLRLRRPPAPARPHACRLSLQIRSAQASVHLLTCNHHEGNAAWPCRCRVSSTWTRCITPGSPARGPLVNRKTAG